MGACVSCLIPCLPYNLIIDILGIDISKEELKILISENKDELMSILYDVSKGKNIEEAEEQLQNLIKRDNVLRDMAELAYPESLRF